MKCIFHLKLLIVLEIQHQSYLISVLSFHAATVAHLTEKPLEQSSNELQLQTLIQYHIFSAHERPK